MLTAFFFNILCVYVCVHACVCVCYFRLLQLFLMFFVCLLWVACSDGSGFPEIGRASCRERV